MTDHTTISFADPAFADGLSDLVRDGAHRIAKQDVQAELDVFLQTHADRTAMRENVICPLYVLRACESSCI